MPRRRVLAAGLALGGSAMGLGTLSGTGWSATRLPDGKDVTGVPTPPEGREGWYPANREPLRPSVLLRLPPGSIRVHGWLAHQLRLQRDGLCGRYPEVSEFLRYEGNGWVDPSQDAWEELPYWLRGYGDLGYVTGDSEVLEATERWINGVLATQAPDGWFGPESLRTSLENGPDFWPGMPMLAALRSWHEYTGDDRIPPFLTRFFAFQREQDPAVFNRSWGAFRWGDTIDVLYWLYNRTGDGWLLDLVHTIHANSADYVNSVPTPHNVNLAQGFREPLQYWTLDGSAHLRDATYGLYDSIMGAYGQFPGGGFAGDENIRRGFTDPRQGFETCGIVEFMQSFQILGRSTGDAVWWDRCEDLAFNSLPAALDSRGRVTHYITSANSVQLDDRTKTRGQFQNDFPMQAYKPGVHDYRCCPHNYGIGWPYLAEELWTATTDLGVCAGMYADSEVRVRVGPDNTEVLLRQRTDYPFADGIEITAVRCPSVNFPLYLRIPAWCARPELSVNGKPVAVPEGEHRYLRVAGVWNEGDVLRLRLPMTTSLRTWPGNHDSVSVDRGPLSYSLRIGEDVRRTGGTERWPQIEVYPTSPWNYGLELPSGDPARDFEVIRHEGLASNPFTPDTVPIELRTRARRIPGWQADPEQVVNPLQPSPARSGEPSEVVSLLPMGAARLRIASFPVIGDGPDAHDWVVPPEVTASHVNPTDSVHAVSDGVMPTHSADSTIPRLTWWDHRGSREWVRYDFPSPVLVSSAEVYWFDDTGIGACRVPASWRLLYLDGSGQWREVPAPSGYGVELDRFNKVGFEQVRTTALRVEAQLQPDYSAGILEWRVPRRTAS